jgi:hypothetical protein
MFQVVQVRSRIVVGARSRFHRGLPDTSSRNSSKSCCAAALSAGLEVSAFIRDLST